MRKWWMALVVLVAVLAGGCLMHSSQKPEPEGEKLPEIVVGSDVYPPFYYMDEKGEPTGIDVELAKEAFRRLGWKPKFVLIDWKNKQDVVEDGRVDCLWGCFTMDGREDQYHWAGPYMHSSQAVAVASDSDIQKLSDLNGRLVAVQATSRPEEILLNHRDPRISQVAKVLVVDSGDILCTLLINGRVDAIAAHREVLWQFAQDYGADYRILDENIMDAHLGVGFSKHDNRQVIADLDRVLNEMRQDGTVRRIASKYIPDAELYMEGEHGGD